jgi:hypothetical protein
MFRLFVELPQMEIAQCRLLSQGRKKYEGISMNIT